MEVIRETMAISAIHIDDGRAPVAEMAELVRKPSKTKQTPAPVTPGDLQAAFRDLLAVLSVDERGAVVAEMRSTVRDMRQRRREQMIAEILNDEAARTLARQLFDF